MAGVVGALSIASGAMSAASGAVSVVSGAAPVATEASAGHGAGGAGLLLLTLLGPIALAAAGLFGRRQPADDETGRRSERDDDASEPVEWQRDAETFRFVYVSPNAEDLLGYPVADWLGDPTLWVPGTDPEDRERARSAYDDVRTGLRDRDLEYRVVTSDGRFIWIREEINVVRDAGGRPTGFRGLIAAVPGPTEARDRDARANEGRERDVPRRRDITTVFREASTVRETPPARETSPVREATVTREAAAPAEAPSAPSSVGRRRESRSEASQRAAAEASARAAAESSARGATEASTRGAQDEDAVALAQALRDPLASILGWARLLRSAALDDATRARALDTIERSAESHVRVLDDILDLATISRGDLRLHMRPVDVALTVQAAVEAARATATAKNVAMRSSIDPALGSIPGDPERLARIVSTLITNAVKFTPKGGRVDVRLDDAGDDLRLTVSDTGRGIKPEVMSRLFERDASTALRGGYGLGLAIARQLVELHGGTLRAESAGEGQGATFTVTLPLSQSERGHVGEAA
jgi:PAS domain S-box-containing protein